MPGSRAAWFVYMLECAGGRIYTGATRDVAARFARHRAGQGGAFTRSFPPRRVLAARRCAGRGEALALEHALKQFDPAGKRRWARAHRYVAPPRRAPVRAARRTRR